MEVTREDCVEDYGGWLQWRTIVEDVVEDYSGRLQRRIQGMI